MATVMLHRTVVALAFVTALSGRLAAKPTPAQSAASHGFYLRGLDAFKQGDYVLASRRWMAGYELDPRPLFLFNIGQAARMMGDHTRAVEYFLKFVAADPNAPERPQVERLIQELSPPPMPAAPEPLPTAPPPLQSIATPAPAPPPPLPPPATFAGAGVAKPALTKRRDRAAAALLGVGLGAIAAGIPVAAWAGSKVSRANDSYAAFASGRDAQAALAAGCAFAAVGAGLAVAGITRWVVVEHRRKLSLAVVPSPSGALAQLGGAF